MKQNGDFVIKTLLVKILFFRLLLFFFESESERDRSVKTANGIFRVIGGENVPQRFLEIVNGEKKVV